MNIKNKIILTIIAIIFAISLFNTNCFAFDYQRRWDKVWNKYRNKPADEYLRGAFGRAGGCRSSCFADIFLKCKKPLVYY